MPKLGLVIISASLFLHSLLFLPRVDQTHFSCYKEKGEGLKRFKVNDSVINKAILTFPLARSTCNLAKQYMKSNWKYIKWFVMQVAITGFIINSLPERIIGMLTMLEVNV